MSSVYAPRTQNRRMKMLVSPNPDEMMQLLKGIHREVEIHGRLVTTKSKLKDFLDQYSGEPDPNCPCDEVVVVARYKYGKKMSDDDRVRTVSYCGLCKRNLDESK
jgi:hypothetical protein